MNRSKFDDCYISIAIHSFFIFSVFLFSMSSCCLFVELVFGVLDGFRMMVIAHKTQKRNERIEKKKDKKRRHMAHAVETFETNDRRGAVKTKTKNKWGWNLALDSAIKLL